MKRFPQRDAAIVLLFTAPAVALFMVRGNHATGWIFFAYCFFLALMQLRRERRTRRRYAARNQFECRVRLPASSRPRWARALATPYPEWMTLQLLNYGTASDTDPLVVRVTDFAGTRKASLSESLFRFNPGWRVASFNRGDDEVLLAAPLSALAAFICPVSSRCPQHMLPRPEHNP